MYRNLTIWKTRHGYPIAHWNGERRLPKNSTKRKCRSNLKKKKVEYLCIINPFIRKWIFKR